MLYCEIPSGLYRRCTTTSSCPAAAAAAAASSPVARNSAWLATVPSVAIAPLAAAGSVASASTRICGRSPRTTRAPKSDGIVTTKATSPRWISASPSAALSVTWSKR